MNRPSSYIIIFPRPFYICFHTLRYLRRMLWCAWKGEGCWFRDSTFFQEKGKEWSHDMRMAGYYWLFKVALIPVATFLIFAFRLFSLILECCSVLSPFDFSTPAAGLNPRNYFLFFLHRPRNGKKTRQDKTRIWCDITGGEKNTTMTTITSKSGFYLCDVHWSASSHYCEWGCGFYHTIHTYWDRSDRTNECIWILSLCDYLYTVCISAYLVIYLPPTWRRW